MVEIEGMTVDQWRPFVKRYLKRFAQHPDFDDMAQEAVVCLWQVSQKYQDLSEERRERIYASAVWKTASDFLRSPRNRARFFNRAGEKIEEALSLEALAEEARAAGRRPFLGVTPDFAPALIERLQLEASLQALSLTPARRRIFERVILAAVPSHVVAREMGLSESRVCSVAAEIRSQMRKVAGLPESPHQYRGVFRRVRGYGARIRIGDLKRYFGTWETAEEAALIADAAILAYGLSGALNLLPESVR